MRFVLKHVLLLFFMLLLIGLLSLTIHGLPDGFTRYLEKKLQMPGLVVEIGKIKLGVFEGVIATDVRCYLMGSIEEPCLRADRVVLQPRLWPYPNSFWLRRVIIKNAQARAGFSPVSSRPFLLENVYGEVFFQDRQTLLAEDLSAVLGGIKISGAGKILLPSASAMRHVPPPAGPRKNMSTKITRRTEQYMENTAIAYLLKYYQRLQFSLPPRINTLFEIHLVEPTRSRLEMRLEVAEAAMQQYNLTSFVGELQLADKTASGICKIRQVAWGDLTVSNIFGEFSVAGDQLTVKKLTAHCGTGSQAGPIALVLNYHFSTRAFEGQLHSGCGPAVILPVLQRFPDAYANEVIRAFVFPRALPQFTAGFSGVVLPTLAARFDGSISLSDFVYADIPLQMAKANLSADCSLTNFTVGLDPIVLVRSDGAMQGKLLFDCRKELVKFQGISTTDPHAAARIIHPVLAKILMPFNFRGNTRVEAVGQASFSGTEQDRMEINANSRSIGYGKLQLEFCDLNIEVDGDNIAIPQISGKFYDGACEANVAIYPQADGEDYQYEADGTLRDANFHRFMREQLGLHADLYEGRVSLDFQLTGPADADAAKKSVGRAALRISQGRIFQIPLFGGLTEILGRIIPGLNILTRQTDVRARFTIDHGKIRSDEILIEGDILSLRANGVYDLEHDALDFKVQLTFMRQHTLVGSLVQLATLPISKMLEFRLEGSLTKPHWRLAYLPRDIFSIFGANPAQK